jgi:hypothetical protein
VSRISRSPNEAEFLERYPEFSRRPMAGGGVRYVGYFERTFTANDLPDIPEEFHLAIEVSPEHPRVVPRAFETAGRIPRSYHKLAGNAFCLSSPLRLAIAVRGTPDLCAFFERFVIPYLYRYAHLQKFGAEPWPDLPHAEAGLLKDYINLFGAPSPQHAIAFLERLGERKRVGNKRPCPCGSGRRVGRCHHRQFEELRRVRPRGWYRGEGRALRVYLREAAGNGGRPPMAESALRMVVRTKRPAECPATAGIPTRGRDRVA